MLKPANLTPVVTPADLTRRWVEILSLGGGPGDPSARTLWIAIFDGDNVQLPVLVPMDDVMPYPPPRHAENIVAAFQGVLAEATEGLGWLSMALERPGPVTTTEDDLAWDREIASAARAAEIVVKPLHLAGSGWILPVDAAPTAVVRYPTRRSA